MPYSTRNESLVHILKEAELVSWGKQQLLACESMYL